VCLRHEDRIVIETPLLIGAPAAAVAILAAPVLAALVTQCTIEIEKVEEPSAVHPQEDR
jgi:hypothetical protein